MCALCDKANDTGEGKSFLDALMSGEIGGFGDLLQQAEADRQATYKAKNDENIRILVEAGHTADNIEDETEAAQTLAGRLMYVMDPQAIAYALALTAVRAARKETADAEDEIAADRMAKAGAETPAPVSAVDLETERPDLSQAIADAERIEAENRRAVLGIYRATDPHVTDR